MRKIQRVESLPLKVNKAERKDTLTPKEAPREKTNPRKMSFLSEPLPFDHIEPKKENTPRATRSIHYDSLIWSSLESRSEALCL